VPTRGVNYGYLERGNKTIAQYTALRALGPDVEYVTLVDDDTRLDMSFSVDKAIKYFEDPRAMALAYPLTAYNPQHDLEWFQAIEYLITGAVKLFHTRLGSTLFASGAFGTFRVPSLIRALESHDCQHRGDDLQTCMKVHAQRSWGRVVAVHDMVATTDVPACMAHPGKGCDCGQPDLFTQRVKGWEVSASFFVPRLLSMALGPNGTKMPIVRVVALYEALTVMSYYVAPAAWILWGRAPGMWLVEVLIMSTAVSLVSMGAFYWKKLSSNDLYIPPEAIIGYNAYKWIILTIYRYLGIAYNLVYYAPRSRDSRTISQRYRESGFAETIAAAF